MAHEHEASDRHPTLRQSPGSDTAPSINPRRRVARQAPLDAAALLDGIRSGDRVALSRAITLVESTLPAHQALASDLVDACLPHAGASIRVGITGVPGVGKSTFIEALGSRLTGEGRRLAVLAVDPSSTHSRGSILGDKTRMTGLGTDPNAFIRPSPSSGSLGGVARATRETIILCEAAGYDTVFVETVGVGQSEVAVHALVDFFLLLALPGAGDELQGIKRGIIEMTDAVAINKAEPENLDRAREARGAYRNALHLYPLLPSGWRPPVLLCSALTGEGIPEVWQTVAAYVEQAKSSGYFDRRRREQARHWMMQTIRDRLYEAFLHHPDVQAALPELERAVMEGDTSSFTAARQLLDLFSEPRERNV